MAPTRTINVQCNSCQGTGLYTGMAEDGRCAVVCHGCKGTGKMTLTYREFTGRKPAPESIKWVYETNPGFKVGGPRPDRFGGMPHEAWAAGKPFPPRSENRECTCPAWWYQCANYKLKPEWAECPRFGSFPSCPSFKSKNLCWIRWDREHAK